MHQNLMSEKEPSLPIQVTERLLGDYQKPNLKCFVSYYMGDKKLHGLNKCCCISV